MDRDHNKNEKSMELCWQLLQHHLKQLTETNKMLVSGLRCSIHA